MIRRRTKGHLAVGGEQLRVAQRTTTTAAPIACLLEWDSAECQIFHHKRPLFAPNLARPNTRHGLITPVLPNSHAAAAAVDSSSSPATLSATSTDTSATTAVSTVTATDTFTAPVPLSGQAKQQAVNGEFHTNTHTFSSILTTATATTTTTATSATAAATTVITPISTRHDSNAVTPIPASNTGIDAAPRSNFGLSHKTVSTNYDKQNTGKPRLFRIAVNDGNSVRREDDVDGFDDHFAFFWPTVRPSRRIPHRIAFTSMPTLDETSIAATKQYFAGRNGSAAFRDSHDQVIRDAYGSNVGIYEKSASSAMAKNKKLGLITLGTSSGRPDHMRHHANNTLHVSSAPLVSSAAPLFSVASSGIQVLSTTPPGTAPSRQPNQNYFEDLWSDIAAPSVIVATVAEEQPRQTSTITTGTAVPPTATSNEPPIAAGADIASGHSAETALPNEYVNTIASTVLPLVEDISTEWSLAVENKPGTREEWLKESELALRGSEKSGAGEGAAEPQTHHKQPQRVLTQPTTSAARHRLRTTLASHTIYAVRPTTPMGELITSTAKAPATPTDFPRTALISIASLSVIIIIAIVVFCVFRCRQSGPSSDQYPMVCNGKQSGYAPIPAEMSPPMMHQDQPGQPHAAFFQNRVDQLNGYQPIKGVVIPNGNSPVGSTKGNGASTNGRKREFKEWYV